MKINNSDNNNNYNHNNNNNNNNHDNNCNNDNYNNNNNDNDNNYTNNSNSNNNSNNDNIFCSYFLITQPSACDRLHAAASERGLYIILAYIFYVVYDIKMLILLSSFFQKNILLLNLKKSRN
jgi:hypothetical protein